MLSQTDGTQLPSDRASRLGRTVTVPQPVRWRRSYCQFYVLLLYLLH